MAEAKTRPTDEDVYAFLGRVENEQRRNDCLAVAEMMRQATGEEPEMWGPSIVGFGRSLLKYASGAECEWPVIGFSPRKGDLTLYVISGRVDQSETISRLGKCKTGKSCLYLKRLSDVDLNVLRELIDTAVRAEEDRRVRRT